MLGASRVVGALTNNLHHALRVGIADWADLCIGLVIWRRVITPVVCGESDSCDLIAMAENLATVYVTVQLLNAVHPVAGGCLIGALGLGILARTWEPRLQATANQGIEKTLDFCRVIGIAALTLCYCDGFYRTWRPPSCWTPIAAVTLIGCFLTANATTKKQFIMHGVRA